MNTKTKIYSIILLSFFLSLIHYLSQNMNFNTFEYNLKVGQIAEKTIIAPFSFPVYKSKDQMELEKAIAAENIPSIYKVSEDIKFSVQKNLDILFQVFATSNFFDNDKEYISSIKSKGYTLSEDVILFLKNLKNREKIYNILTTNLEKIMNIGIYSDDLDVKSITVYTLSKQLKNFNLTRLYAINEAKNNLIKKIADKRSKRAISEIYDALVVENIIVDKEKTQAEEERISNGINPILKEVLKNEEIVAKNKRITSLDVAILKALQDQSILLNRPGLSLAKSLLYFCGLLLIYTVEILCIEYILSNHFYKVYKKVSHFYIVYLALLVFFILNLLFMKLFVFAPLIMPFALFPFLISVIFSAGVGYIYAVFQTIFMVQQLNWDFTIPLIFLISTLIGITSANRTKFSMDNIPILMFISLITIYLSVSLIKLTPPSAILKSLFYLTISVSLTFIGYYLLLPLIEKKLKIISKRTILSLLDYEHPLLKQLSTKAPGTYFHSLIVGNIAEKIAQEIGADPLISRACSYYHDIGKINDPSIFGENNMESSKLHKNMSIEESVKRIRKHIEDGVEILTFYKFPEIIVSGVYEHHGTNKMIFFENKAKELNISKEKDYFRYYGPKPQSKETAIVMISDIIESTIKSLKYKTDKTIEGVIESTITKLINDKQLVKTPITLKDLSKVKGAVIPVIKGIYHTREEYSNDTSN